MKVGDSLVKVKVGPDFEVDIGKTIWMVIDKKKIHIFDKKTEKVII